MTTDARVRITAQNDTAAAFREITRAGSELGDKLHSMFATAFAGISIAGLWEGVKGAIDLGDAIAKAAEKSGMATAAFSQLAYAAKQNNVDMDALSKGVKNMQVAIDKGSSSFDSIGINLNKLHQLRPDQQFEAIAEAISRINDPAARAHAAIEIFGKAGADLLPILDKGAAGIEALRAEADQLGLTLDEKGAKSLEAAEKSIKQVDAAFQGLSQTLAVKLAPALEDTFNFWRVFFGGGTQIENLQIQLHKLIEARDFALKNRSISQLEGLPQVLQQIEVVRAKLAQLRNDASDMTLHTNLAAGIIGDPNAVAKAWETLKDVTAEKKELLKLTLLQIDATMREIDVDEASSKRQLGYSMAAMDADKNMRLAHLKGTIEENQQLLDSIKVTYNKLEDVARSAAEGMKADFEQFFYDPMKEGLRGLLSAFIDTVRRMIAQAAAAKLMQSLFGDDAGSGFFGKILGSIFGAVAGGSGSGASGSYGYGGAAAGGGPVMGGMAYLVGERGPELFIPSGSGSIRPNSSGAGDVINTITINQSIDARGAQEGQAAQFGRVMQANNESLKRDILDGIRRRKYPI